MIKIPRSQYSILNGKKWFRGNSGFEIQCAYCLFLQDRTFIRNKEGLIVGLDLRLGKEEHSYDCKQK